MAITSLQITYAELREELGIYLSGNRTVGSWSSTQTSDVSHILRSGLRKAYYPPSLGPGQPAHQWSFLRPWDTITTNEPYSSGTITVANGVVTLSVGGQPWPSWAAGGFIAYGGKYYEVSTRDSNSQLTLVDVSSDNDASSGTTYTLYQYRFTLPSDFESLDGPMYYSPDQSTDNVPLTRRSDTYLRMLYQDSDTDTFTSEPKFFAIYPGSPSATTAAQVWYMIIWPFPRLVFHLKYRYHVQMFDLDGTNTTPPGGAQHSEMILEAVLSEAELKLNDGVGGEHTAKWKELLAASIMLDREIITPDTLGCVPIKSPDYGHRVNAVTPEDYVIHPDYTLADFTS